MEPVLRENVQTFEVGIGRGPWKSNDKRQVETLLLVVEQGNPEASAGGKSGFCRRRAGSDQRSVGVSPMEQEEDSQPCARLATSVRYRLLS
jgi:hypothetical protein